MRNIDNLLESYSRFGIDLSLDRVKYLLDKLGNPQNKIPIIHVAGTNGKGSVCAFLSSILQAAGYRTGRYTSPHLVDWRERICIDGNWIPVDHIYQALNAVIKQISDRCIPTQFELITCAMWWYFAQQQIDIAVIETGLGGRLDATNVCDRPLVAVITSISRDHWQRLGDSLGQIAREKAGIIKPHCPVVIGKLPPEARTPILERAQALHSRVIEIFQGVDYDLPLPGEHQRLNCALAIGAVEQLQGWDIKAEHIHRGIATTQWPGRLEWTTYKGAKVLLDGAHNLGGGAGIETIHRSNSPKSSSSLDHGYSDYQGLRSYGEHPAPIGGLVVARSRQGSFQRQCPRIPCRCEGTYSELCRRRLDRKPRSGCSPGFTDRSVRFPLSSWRI